MKRNIVLFVDDEANILSSIRRAVIDQEFESRFAYSGQDALSILAQEPVCVLVTDMRMPGMDGLSLLKVVKEKYPQIIKLVLSGYTQLSQVLATVNQGDIFKFIAKPWKMQEELIDSITQALEYYNLRRDAAFINDALQKRNTAYQNVLKMMDDKVAQIKSDIESIKRFDQWIFHYTGELLSDIQEPEQISILLKKLEVLKALHAAYMDTWPSTESVFDPNKFFDDLEMILLKIYPRECLEFKRSNYSTAHYYGNHKFMLFVLAAAAKYLPQQPGSKLSCSVVNESRKGLAKLTIHFRVTRGEALPLEIELLGFVVTVLNRISAEKGIQVILSEEEMRVVLSLYGELNEKPSGK